MRALVIIFHLVPLSAFALAYWYASLNEAIISYLAASALQLLVFIIAKHFKMQHIGKYMLSIGLSTLTLATGNILFFILEITIYYGSEALLLTGQLLFRKFLSYERTGSYFLPKDQALDVMRDYKWLFVFSILLNIIIAAFNIWTYLNMPIDSWALVRVLGPAIIGLLIPLALACVTTFNVKTQQ